MVPTNFSLGSLWNSLQSTSILDVDFLMPNGFLLTIKCANDEKLKDIKTKLFIEAQKQPLFDKLKSLKDYVLSSVGKEANIIEYYDESIRLTDINLFYPFFKLIEINGNIEERILNSEIVIASGVRKDNIEKIENNFEIVDFRYKMMEIVFNEINRTKNFSIEEHFPHNLDLDLNFLVPCPIDNRVIEIIVRVKENDKLFEQVFRVKMLLNNKPIDLVSEIIKLKLHEMKQSEAEILNMILRYRDTYLLNVCGSDELIYGNNHHLGSYKYIKECLSKEITPEFRLVSLNAVRSKLIPENDFTKSYIENELKSRNEFEKKTNLRSRCEISWNVSNKFLISVEKADYLPSIDDCDLVFCKMAIYHGQELVSNIKYTNGAILTDAKWNKTIELDFEIRNIHRCAKFCFGFYYTSKTRHDSHLIGWISLNVFDYRGVMLNGLTKLNLWPVVNNTFEKLNLSNGASGQNPNKDFICITVDFPTYVPNFVIMYPSIDQINNKFLKKFDDRLNDECLGIEECDIYRLSYILNAKKDSLSELTEQDKEEIWNARYEICSKYPNSLPKLIQSVNWSLKQNQIEIYRLLHKPWPIVDVVVALELLNSFYFDCQVRKFAVRCLDLQLTDSLVHEYLLQLIQALKNETYFDNELARFLLNRALKSLKIGFDFFWILKTETNNLKYKYRFGILLEAYCRGIGSHFNQLLKQIHAINKLSCLSDKIKENREDLTIFTSSFLADTLNLPEYKQVMSEFLNPLNRYERLGNLNSSKCKILTSAKRPLILAWNKIDEFSGPSDQLVEVIFKQGDDLRQDMLTLQILRLMDYIWKQEGLDMKMLVYKVISTGFNIGFIEKVKAKTLFQIQMEGGKASTYQIDTLSLFRWICDNNPNDKLNKAINNFTKSCAAYCVATFIIGIGDRHPDNIMVSKEGHIFHIDFGHFLGNFKKKFGIRRERVPFVLTEDLIKVITKGSSNPCETKEFKDFKKLCVDAYVKIRRHSNLIINLFNLMTTGDIPELQSIEDIKYLSETMALNMSEEAAKQYFIDKLDESYTKSIKTKIDWVFHALNKKNLIQ